ncbi:MAG: class I tRNA ligase family protein [Patescibacteria group bacterium]
MHKRFDSAAIEKKWQEIWAEQKLYEVGERDTSKEKEYVLVELPYPSGNLHIGHWHAFAVPDIYVRFLRMSGKQVIYPMGFDAFGLPAENAAIKRNINPREWTESNIEFMKGQLQSMGASFSWDKTASTIDPNYYKWTQWMFTKFFENDLAYRGEAIVNWDPVDNTVIANEQVLADGTSERSGAVVEKKVMPQWMLRITKYADRLIDDLDNLDWPEPIKEAQRRWIGRSEGAEIDFKLSTGDTVTVFTTRPDTLFGATYMVLAPEHALVKQNKDKITNWDTVESYVKEAAKKDEQDRLNDTKEKTGVKLEGITATNPANNEEIPVYIADYVLASYGTGAIMAVPAHDERDGAFANKYNIKTVSVVYPVTGIPQENPEFRESIVAIVHNPKNDLYATINWKDPQKTLFVGGGIDSGESPEQAAVREIREETPCEHLELVSKTTTIEHSYFAHSKNVARKISAIGLLFTLTSSEETAQALEVDEADQFHFEWKDAQTIERELDDELHKTVWNMLVKKEVFTSTGKLMNSGEFNGMDSEEAKEAITKKVGGRMTSTYRMRDWSVGRQRYWGVPIPIVYDPEGKAHVVPEEHLPWLLPEDVDHKPTGEAPLAKSKELKERTEKIFGKGWTPEVETMDAFVDSSWYFLRYIDNQNDSAPVSTEAQKDWMPIDLYFGGAEHTTMHLLYSRFWQKALYDLKLVAHEEPYQRRINRGLILGPDGNKMSKSKGNVIDPDEQVKLVGGDSVKMYLAFMGPYGETANYPWDMGGIAGIRRFLEKVNGLHEHLADTEPESVTKQLHKTIAKLNDDIPVFKFNTAISAMMVFVNLAEKEGLSKESYRTFLTLLAPFATHLSEELWEQAGNTTSIHREPFPEANKELVKDDEVTIGVQINGKHRGEITIAPDASETIALVAAKADAQLAEKLGASEPKKVIYVPGRILNIII